VLFRARSKSLAHRPAAEESIARGLRYVRARALRTGVAPMLDSAGCCPDPHAVSSGKQLTHTAGNQHRYIHQHARQRQSAASHQVLRHPDRLELALVATQALEVVEMLAIA